MDSAAVLGRIEGEALATLADGGGCTMKVLIVDDHALFREGLVLLLEALQQNVEALQAEEATSAFAQLAAHPDLDVVLLDLVMPGPGGIDLLQEIKRISPTVPVVILSSEEGIGTVTDAIEKGASGYIPKTSTGEIMRGALRLVMGGGIYIPPIVLRDEPRPAAASQPGAPTRAEEIGMSPRQVAVLDCLLVGMPTKVIASRLGISENTVKTHIMAIFRTLKVRNRTEAVLEASRYGFKVGRPWRRGAAE
jgi:DNA-binding NarL/FixJ family response regulator